MAIDLLGLLTNAAATILEKVPFEKMIIKPPDPAKEHEELRAILIGSANIPAAAQTSKPSPSPARNLSNSPQSKTPTDKDTIIYQNREIGKIILQMERHSSQRFRINGIACECGSNKHLLDLEELCEETIPMVGDDKVYFKIIELGKELAPKVAPDIVASGQYDEEYPEYSKKYRDLRKELFGTLDYTPLFEKRKSPALLDKVTTRNNELVPTEEIEEVMAGPVAE
jgi:hypothetical protein